MTAADIANAVVVDLHGLGRVFRPLHLFLVNHDLLNEQPQQLDVYKRQAMMRELKKLREENIIHTENHRVTLL